MTDTNPHEPGQHRGRRRRTLTERMVTSALVAAALVHLIPSVGVLGADTLDVLYGTDLHDNDNDIDNDILLRHRAVLFGILGIATLTAAWTRRLQTFALVANLASVASFVVIAVTGPDTTPAIERVTLLDAVLAVLIAASIAETARERTNPNSTAAG